MILVNFHPEAILKNVFTFRSETRAVLDLIFQNLAGFVMSNPAGAGFVIFSQNSLNNKLEVYVKSACNIPLSKKKTEINTKFSNLHNHNNHMLHHKFA